jgi:hypothetical protein
MMFYDFVIYQKFKGGTLIKCLISMMSNLGETLKFLKKKISMFRTVKNWVMSKKNVFRFFPNFLFMY